MQLDTFRGQIAQVQTAADELAEKLDGKTPEQVPYTDEQLVALGAELEAIADRLDAINVSVPNS